MLILISWLHQLRLDLLCFQERVQNLKKKLCAQCTSKTSTMYFLYKKTLEKLRMYMILTTIILPSAVTIDTVSESMVKFP